MDYTVKRISPKAKNELIAKLAAAALPQDNAGAQIANHPAKSAKRSRIPSVVCNRGLYQKKADIHGTCIKLFTDNRQFSQMWEENFRSMPDSIRPHGRIFAISDGGKLEVCYEPVSKTVIIRNCGYYGWVKSIALALVADFFEDFVSEHRRYSVHGSFIDHAGRGIAIIGPSGSGKTTLTYGLLQDNRLSFLTDDWFFVRLYENEVRAFSSEQNSYIREDLLTVWPMMGRRIRDISMDANRRAIVDIKTVFGEGRIKEDSVLTGVVLLKRDKADKRVFTKISAAEALEFMRKNDFCNPHQLVRTPAKHRQRMEFFAELFGKLPVYLLNTVETPEQSLARIRGIID